MKAALQGDAPARCGLGTPTLETVGSLEHYFHHHHPLRCHDPLLRGQYLSAWRWFRPADRPVATICTRSRKSCPKSVPRNVAAELKARSRRGLPGVGRLLRGPAVRLFGSTEAAVRAAAQRDARRSR